MHSLEDYYELAGDKVISDIHKKARKLYGKHILHINSTCQGGGVAGILASLIPLMNDVGIEAGWRILHGNPDFFSITKKFHNALQGEQINLSEIKKELYTQTNKLFSVYTHINHDCVLIHDPQPLPLIKLYEKKQPWIWRCHIDLSHPNEEIWEFLKRFILRYDAVILSNKKYRSKHLPVEQRVIYPAIDPLSAKNKELSEGDISKYLKKFRVPTDKPLIVQVSRFDKWKDPVGVIEVFNLVKEKIDCRLVLCGSMAGDDPEGWMIYEMLKKKANRLIENKDIIFITSENSILVNALQRSSAVIVQKSIREGFGLTVTEGLWKEKPVVATNVGGISLQIDNGKNGFLVEPSDIKGFAQRVVQVLKNRKLAEKLGKKGREIVKEKFLITRLLSDYLDLLNEMIR
ncbi:MAG: glycosyl transferase family 1 [Candidatus Omnitrophica bacterium 4484_213]|nr:MAG: glycosyl transferase family 1 [Candidatus Omnitrophica bacterium 4484_213]